MADQFLHAADLHLGARLESLGGHVDDETAEYLRSEAAKAFGDLIQLAIDEQVAFVVLAGDVYDGAHRETARQFEVLHAFERLDEADIAVFMAHGNHDPVEGRFAKVGAYPPNVHVFAAGEVTSEVVELPHGGTAQVSGISFENAREPSNLARHFATLDAPGMPHIAVLHANVGDNADHGNYAPCSLDDLRAAPVHYWALGHIHRRTIYDLGNGHWAVYPGNLQGRSFKPAEAEPKGAVLVPIDPSSSANPVGEPSFVSCDRLRFCLVEADVTDATDLEGAVRLAADKTTERLREQDARPVLARVALVGRPRLEDGTDLADERDTLCDQIGQVVAADLHGGAVTRVDVATRPVHDPAELRQRQDLVASVLLELDELRADEGGTDLLTRALDGLETPADMRDTLRRLLSHPDHVAELLDGVETLLLDELVD